MFKIEERSLIEITEKLKNLLKDNLIAVIAFGSRVRGDFYGESDFDVLVIVEHRDYEIIKKIIALFYEEEERTNIQYSVIVKDKEAFEKERFFNTGFYRNILDEGRIFYGKITY